MREVYSFTITAITELGGADYAVTSDTWVCDRCGRQIYKDEAVKDPAGWKVCPDCKDKKNAKDKGK